VLNQGALNQGALNPSALGEFVFTPMQAGVLERDSDTIRRFGGASSSAMGTGFENGSSGSTPPTGITPGRAIRQLAGRGPGAIVWLADVLAGHPIRDSEAAAHAPSGGFGHPGGLAAVGDDDDHGMDWQLRSLALS
jgi:hypothetical protein